MLQRKVDPMNALSPVLSFLPALLAVAAASASLILLLRSGRLPSARPNKRSLHRTPVPKGGGLSLWIGWLAGTAWLPALQPWLVPLLMIIAVSFWDDRYDVPVGARLLVQTMAACTWLWLAKAPVNPVAAVVAIVWMANLFNFMDGSDGLALAMAMIGFGAYAIAASMGEAGNAVFLWALAAAVGPCLVLNFPPARVFMGDVGAVPLGFVAATFGISGWYEGTWPGWFPVLVFLPFVADASTTLVLRALRGTTIWKAHREHFYQKLVLLGWGHRGTLMLYGALMLGTASSALLALLRAPGSGLFLLVLWGAVMALLFGAIGYHWRAREQGAG